MTIAAPLQTATAKPQPSTLSASSRLLQRKCACGASTSALDEKCDECNAHTLQKKLVIGASNDPLEQEADRVAEMVVTPSLAAKVAEFGGGGTVNKSSLKPMATIQRRVEDDFYRSDEVDEASPSRGSESVDEYVAEEESQADQLAAEEDGMDELGGEEDIVADETGRPKRELGAAGGASQLNGLPIGSGFPINQNVRIFMERRIGHDFKNVRVHADAEAVNSARKLRAQAYTVGEDIYFNAGRYNTQSIIGLRLLAHELAHVAQQGRGASIGCGAIQRKADGMNKLRRRAPDRPVSKGQPKRMRNPCDGPCAPAAKAQIHDGCSNGGAAAQNTYIVKLTVYRAGHRVVADWSDGPPEIFPCSPSTKSGPNGKVPTPLGKDKVGVKCDKCHTNQKGAGMGWFTGFSTKYKAIGFHNSQKVGMSFESHGCVRVSCEVARKIQENSYSGKTEIEVKK